MWDALSQRLEEGIRQIVLFLPRLLAALGILMAGFAIAKMVERGTDVALHKIGFDRWMQDGGVTEALERAGTRLDPSSVIAKLTFWTVMLLVILLAADALGIQLENCEADNPSGLRRSISASSPRIAARRRSSVLASAGGLPGGPTLGRSAKAAVILLAVFMALEQLDIAQDIVLVFFIAVVGAAALAAGIAFGLGARDIAGEVSREWYDRMRFTREKQEAGPGPVAAAPPPAPAVDVGTPPPNDARE